MGLPNVACMLNSAADEKVLRKMTNMTVAMTEAPIVKSAVQKVRTMIGNDRRKIRFVLCVQRGLCEKAMGAKNMQRNVRQAPMRKLTNIQKLAVRTMCRTVTTSVGKEMVAPESSSLRMIWTGLNQYNVFGREQNVIPSPL